MQWRNAVGKEFEKRFMFTEKDFPASDITTKGVHPYVTFEFNQEGLIGYYTHRTPGALERGKKAGKLMQQLRMEWLKKQPR